MVWLKATLAGDGIAKAFDEVGHSALPFTVATIGTDGFSESFDLNSGVRVCFYAIIRLMNVVFTLW